MHAFTSFNLARKGPVTRFIRLGWNEAPSSGFTMFDKLGTWPDDFTGLIVYISTSNANNNSVNIIQ